MSFSDVVASKKFILLAEMETHKGVDISAFVENARRVKGRVDAVLVPDMSHAVMRMSTLAGAALLKQQGLAVVAEVSCRDRNRLALQGDMLGAAVLGVNTLVPVTGEPVNMGDQLGAVAVNDLDPLAVLAAAGRMSRGEDMSGIPLKGSPEFCLGYRVASWQDAAGKELAQAKEAVDNGAKFILTPPVFDLGPFQVFMKIAEALGVPVIPSVILLKSVGMARYISQHIKGIKIGEETISRIRTAKDRPAECIKIAAETINGLKDLAGGALIVTTGWENRLPEILEAVA